METAAQNGKNGHTSDEHRAGQHDRERIRSYQLAISASEGAQACVQEVVHQWRERGHQATVLPAVQSNDTAPQQALDGVDGVLALSFTALADALIGQQTANAPLLLEQLAQPEMGERSYAVVIVPGGMDVVRFNSREAMPLQFGRRRVIAGPDNSVLMRADVSESARMGRLLAEKINQVTGEMAVCLPLRGLSQWDKPGEPLYSMEANMALYGNLTTHLRRDIRLYDSNVHINDPAFAVLCVDTLQTLMEKEHPQR